jgi:hypothetical protein
MDRAAGEGFDVCRRSLATCGKARDGFRWRSTHPTENAFQCIHSYAIMPGTERADLHPATRMPSHPFGRRARKRTRACRAGKGGSAPYQISMPRPPLPTLRSHTAGSVGWAKAAPSGRWGHGHDPVLPTRPGGAVSGKRRRRTAWAKAGHGRAQIEMPRPPLPTLRRSSQGQRSADAIVLTRSIVTVIGPTPPGTGVM